ncbi:DUF7402 domain-containing protein [Enterovibrio norvegicus]|uniref:GlcNAc-PI de-N-acetylase n=1 Tax=Enterovibrio norvegicus DSM 15893 TaxID=1121869 RepID=A0A1I5VG54_9GAMM|nr:PIG-L family deacetylase [Enterovibrio norvegicus]SFQ06528.1 GlcNAc-PI de-N-acetylase [Enterovibrio norvegicus DSM 15893]
MKKAALGASLALCLFSQFAHSSTLSIYVAAHADDWQLFMNPSAYNDVKNPSNKVVFLHFTAGDAGLGDGPLQHPKYIAREEGAKSAIRFMVNTQNGARGREESVSTVTVNDHTLERSAYSNTVSYFFRLPDGSGNGSGYNFTGYSSLEKLRNGDIDQLLSVDGADTFDGWKDLVWTIEQLIAEEAVGFSTIQIHAAETNIAEHGNHGDHSDHQAVSWLMQDIQTFSLKEHCFDFRFYQNYRTASLARNVSDSELIVNARTWGVTTGSIADNYHSSTWDHGHNAWLTRMYRRELNTNTACQTRRNIAKDATITASSENNSTGQTADNTVDGVYSGYPTDYNITQKAEWASNREKSGAWIKYEWDESVTLDQITLYDRPNLVDHITGGEIVFHDGNNSTTLPFNQLSNNGFAVPVRFNSKQVNAVTIRVTSTSQRTANTGLAEVEMFSPFE